MKTKIFSIKEAKRGTTQIHIESPSGEEYILGFLSPHPLCFPEEYSEAIAIITDNFEKRPETDNVAYWNYLNRELLLNQFTMCDYLIEHRDVERVRLGGRIKELRESRDMEAKILAEEAGITPSNLCRIEQGKYSPGLDVMSRIATALGMRLDFVPKEEGGKK